TYSTLNLREYRVEYDHMDSSYDATEMSAGLSHAFNQQWQGNVEGGVTQVRPDFVGAAKNTDTLNPLVNAGLVYSPSPRTRFSGDFGYSYKPSDESGYGGQTVAELRFGAQHDITAKLMAKATARFAKIDKDEADKQTALPISKQDDRMDIDLRLSYKLNRINFIELGMRHSERTSDGGSDWKQNVVDIGWRVELN
ncbi:MAG: outer membrane beta-barrel protein, partial [Kiritimatiellales bacterium]